MRTQEQEEYRNNLIDEMDAAEDIGYDETEEEPAVYRAVDTGKPPWYYLVTFGITAALALGVHSLAFHSDTKVTPFRGYTGYGEDILPDAFKIDGVTYQMPLQYQQLINEGWSPEYEEGTNANDLRSVISDTEVWVIWTKGDITLYTYMTPPEGVEKASIEECVSYWGDVFSVSDDEVMPCGIAIGMSEDDLIEILDEYASEYTTSEYSNDACDYEMENDDYSVTICVIDQEVYDVYISEWY